MTRSEIPELTEVFQQGIHGELLLDAQVVAPHGGGQVGIPWRRGWLADESCVQRGGRIRRGQTDGRDGGFVGMVVISPRLPVHPVADGACDPDATPVEIA